MSQRIFLHTPEPRSSAALYLDELARALTRIGIALHVICPANHQALKSFKANSRIRVHPTANRVTRTADGLLKKFWTNLLFLFSSCFTLFRSAQRGDLVHFQYVLHFPFGALFFLCARLRGCLIVLTAHDPLPHKWLFPAPLHVFEKWTLSWSYRCSDVLLVHSEAGRRTLTAHFPDVVDKIRVIAHGPYELNVPISAPPKSGCLEVILFGALRENKGAHLAITAVQQLYREDVPVRLTIAGGVLNRKEQEYWNRCRQMVANCPEPIRLIEQFIPNENLFELFASCHCFLLPYTNFSSDSGVAFLALANGRPIISTRSGGLGDLIESSGGGLAIEEPTATAVGAALREALDLGFDHLDQLGRAGRMWVLEECGWPTVAAQTRRIYETCLGTTLANACGAAAST